MLDTRSDLKVTSQKQTEKHYEILINTSKNSTTSLINSCGSSRGNDSNGDMDVRSNYRRF